MTLAVGTFCVFFPPEVDAEAVFLDLPEEVQIPMLARAAYAIAGDGYLVQNLVAGALLRQLEDGTVTLSSLLAPYLSDPAVCARYEEEPPAEALAAARDAGDGFCPFPEAEGFVRDEKEVPPGKEVLIEVSGFLFFH